MKTKKFVVFFFVHLDYKHSASKNSRHQTLFPDEAFICITAFTAVLRHAILIRPLKLLVGNGIIDEKRTKNKH